MSAKFFALLFLVLGASLWAEEKTEVRAYYIGKQDPEWFSFDDKDPFSFPESSEWIRVEDAPTDSVFFEKDDVLWKLKEKHPVNPASKSKWAVYNQTTGRYVVEAGRATHRHLEGLVDAWSDHWPFGIEGELELYLLPSTGLIFPDHENAALPVGLKPITSLAVSTMAGGLATVRLQNPALVFEWEPNTGGHLNAIDHRFKLKGYIGESYCDFSSGIVTRGGKPILMELGQAGSDSKVLALKFKSTFLYNGEVSRNRFVLNSQGKEKMDIVERDQYYEESSIDSVTGKILRTFQVNPTFISYLDVGVGDSSGNDDPFAADVEGDTKPAKIRPTMASWDHRVRAKPGDRVVDVSDLFVGQGIKFTEDDFTVLNKDANQLTALLDSKNMEFFEMIVNHGGCSLPRKLTCYVTIVEGNTPFRVGDLAREDLRCVGKAVTHGKPGLKSTLALKTGEHEIVVDLEPNIGANDQLMHLRIKLSAKSGKDAFIDLATGVILWNGTPKIIQSRQFGDKWQASLSTSSEDCSCLPLMDSMRKVPPPELAATCSAMEIVTLRIWAVWRSSAHLSKW